MSLGYNTWQCIAIFRALRAIFIMRLDAKSWFCNTISQTKRSRWTLHTKRQQSRNHEKHKHLGFRRFQLVQLLRYGISSLAEQSLASDRGCRNAEHPTCDLLHEEVRTRNCVTARMRPMSAVFTGAEATDLLVYCDPHGQRMGYHGRVLLHS